MPDGTIWTGFYSDWEQLSKEDRQTVMNARVENKNKGTRKRQTSEVSTGSKKLKDIKLQMAELKRTLASIQSKQSSGTVDDDGNDSDTPDNAGDSFGGRQKKKQKKE
ncbi:hypothetical protein MHU86_77 [Fragilaria crotonensis]|nr:hypothetical protein MHU86_77 [Fragilaria crotonensis]